MTNQAREAQETLEQLISKKNKLLKKIIEHKKLSLKTFDKNEREINIHEKWFQQIKQIDTKIEYLSELNLEFKDEEKILSLLKKQEILLRKLAKRKTDLSNKKRKPQKKTRSRKRKKFN